MSRNLAFAAGVVVGVLGTIAALAYLVANVEPLADPEDLDRSTTRSASDWQ